MAEFLRLPDIFTRKAPSAGLWAGQTDENELGFSYEVADQVLHQYIDEKRNPDQIKISESTDQLVVKKVINRVNSQRFKLEVPYQLDSSSLK